MLSLGTIIYSMINFGEGGNLEKILVLPIFIKTITVKREINELVERMNLAGNSIYVWSLTELVF